jgi:hypothetical protein
MAVSVDTGLYGNNLNKIGKIRWRTAGPLVSSN